MALNIRNREADQLAEAIASLTGETKTEAVIRALRERLDHLKHQRARHRLADELDEIARYCATLPIRDQRSDEAILGYDEHGMPA